MSEPADISTLDLVPRDGFVLIAGLRASQWASAAEHAAATFGPGADGIAPAP